MSAELAVLLAGVGARQAASATARAQAALAPRPADAAGLLAPDHGSFNGGVARELTNGRSPPEDR